jgi:hypothetical protein
MVMKSGKDGFIPMVAIGVFTVIASVATAVSTSNEPPNHGVEKKERYSIDLDEQSKRQLLDRAKTIKPGSSVDQVKALLGPPTHDQMILSKKGEFRTRVLEYDIRAQGNLVNDKIDRYLAFYFDQANKLTKIGYKLTDKPEAFN